MDSAVSAGNLIDGRGSLALRRVLIAWYADEVRHHVTRRHGSEVVDAVERNNGLHIGGTFLGWVDLDSQHRHEMPAG